MATGQLLHWNAAKREVKMIFLLHLCLYSFELKPKFHLFVCELSLDCCVTCVTSTANTFVMAVWAVPGYTFGIAV